MATITQPAICMTFIRRNKQTFHVFALLIPLNTVPLVLVVAIF